MQTQQLTDLLMAFVVVVPLVAVASIVVSGRSISERHHLHHDTFVVSGAVSRTQVLVMFFMGLLGTLTGWLCHLGVFDGSPLVPVSFFATFQLGAIILFTIICRPRVTAFDEEMYVRHVIGITSIVRYDDIVRIRRVPMPFMPEFDSLIIELRDGRSVTMSGLLDIDRILLRIDRFDVLED
jgi:hypothetical protein